MPGPSRTIPLVSAFGFRFWFPLPLLPLFHRVLFCLACAASLAQGRRET